MMEEAQQLLQDSSLAEAVRPGDVYALMIECVQEPDSNCVDTKVDD